MKRRYNMPFGAECREDGSVRFRLWAPAARRVELCLDRFQSALSLDGLDEGWFELSPMRRSPAQSINSVSTAGRKFLTPLPDFNRRMCTVPAK